MEVHHHSHAHGKKTWKGYFWEFLMLFLAVFCGFLAEYQLEHKIEKDREKQYMRSMLEDLRSDSAMLADNFLQRKKRIEMTDSLFDILAQPASARNMNDAYFFARSISPPLNIFPNDRTIQQLKSSGNLRLIRKQDISNSIMTYDQKMRQVLFEMGDEVEVRKEYRQAAINVFDTRVFQYIIAGQKFNRPVNNPPLHTNNPDLVNTFIGALQYTKRIHVAQMRNDEDLLKLANELMDKIKKEYQLK